MKPLKRLKEIIESNILTEQGTEEKVMEDKPNELKTKNMENNIDKEDNLNSHEETQQEYEVIEREILPESIICPDCGGITLEGLDFCDKCGGELHIYNR